MTWFIILAVLAALALITFLVKQNLEDKKAFEKHLNEDYTKPKDKVHEPEIDPED